MRAYKSPQRGHCASCEGILTGQPVYRMDEIYCCIGCANFGPCTCTYEADLAEDGVDHLGLPFAIESTGKTTADEYAPLRADRRRTT